MSRVEAQRRERLVDRPGQASAPRRDDMTRGGEVCGVISSLRRSGVIGARDADKRVAK